MASMKTQTFNFNLKMRIFNTAITALYTDKLIYILMTRRSNFKEHLEKI